MRSVAEVRYEIARSVPGAAFWLFITYPGSTHCIPMAAGDRNDVVLPQPTVPTVTQQQKAIGTEVSDVHRAGS